MITLLMVLYSLSNFSQNVKMGTRSCSVMYVTLLFIRLAMECRKYPLVVGYANHVHNCYPTVSACFAQHVEAQ